MKETLNNSEEIQDSVQESNSRIKEYEGRIKEFNSESAHFLFQLNFHSINQQNQHKTMSQSNAN